MTTLWEEVEAAAFWDGWVCLACDRVSTEEEAHEEAYGVEDACPECGVGALTPAGRVKMFLERVAADEDRD